MCGRTASSLAPDELVRACTYRDKTGKKRQPQWKDARGGQQYTMSYNIAPTAHCPVLLSGKDLSSESSERVLMPMKWGLTPSWHKDDPYKVPFETNNCRVEGMLEKKTYKVPLHKGRRCVVLMDGFFEWKTSKDGKQPYFFHFPQSTGFSFSNKHHSVKAELKSEDLDLNPTKRLKIDCDSVKEEEKQSPFLDGIPTDCVSGLEQKTSVDSVPNERNTPNKESPVSSTQNVPGVSSENKLGKRDHDDCVQLSTTIDPSTNSEVGEWTGQRLLTVAGVYDIWQSSTSTTPLYSYSVITVPASDEFSWCHHRMPAILTSDEEVEKWLNTASVSLTEASNLIRPTKGLTYYPVTKAVGNSRYKEPDCIAPMIISKPKPSASSNLMMNWLKKGGTVKKE